MCTITSMGESKDLEQNPAQREPSSKLPASLRKAPRCQAKTRQGLSCLSPAANGKRVCRMHGGSKKSGAPRGERHPKFKHGRWSVEARAERAAAHALLRSLKDLV